MAGLTLRARGILVSGLAALLVACGGGDEPPAPVNPETAGGEVVERSRSAQAAAERRERERQALAEAEEGRFVYFRYAPDTSGEQPRACLVFSQPLDPEIDYATYIRMKPKVRPAYAVEGRELCLEGLDFAQSYTATILEGLPSVEGAGIEREEEVQISFEDRPAYVGFKGAGVILPRENADGLPIETVNVDEVDVTVYRVNDRALAFKSISQGDEAAQGRYSYLYGEEDPRDVSTEIWSGSMDIDNVTNAPVTTVFPLQDVIGELKPGSYFVEIQDARELSDYDGPAASARRWIMLTNLALTGYRGENGLDVTLRSLQDGEVLSNTRVQLVAFNNEVLAESETGENGRVRFDAPLLAGTGNSAPRMVMAFGAKGDLAVLDLSRAPIDLSEMSTGGRTTPGPVDGYLYADRGIFRPGETVHLTAMMRDRSGVAISDRAGQLVMYRPNGVEADRMRFTAAEGGALVWDYELSKTASRGMWRVVLEIDGAPEAGSLRFSVEDFVPQRIAVELDADEDDYIPAGGSRLISVESRFLYGAPGAGLTVEGQARLETDPSPFEAFDGFEFGRTDEQFREEIIEFEPQTTDGAGRATVRLDPGGRGDESSYPLRLNANVSVMEPGGRAVTESVRIPYRPRDVYLGIRKDFEGRAEEGGPARFELAALSDSGDVLDTRLDWRVIAIDYHYDWYREDGQWRWRRSRTVRTVNEGVVDTDGTTQSVSVDGLEWGRHELIVSAADGSAEASTAFQVGWGGSVSDDGVEAPDRVEVVIDEQTIVPGRPAAVTIVAPYDGEAQIVVATDKILRVETRDVSAEGTQFTLPVTEEWGEGAYVLVNVYTPRDPVLQAKPRRAVGVGYIPVDMDARTFDVEIDAPDIVRPRREQTIRVDIGDGPREGVYMTLAAVDEGILQLTKFQSPDPVDYYFGKKALGVDIYDDYGRLLDPNMGLPAEVRTGGDQLGGEGLSVVPTKTVALFSGKLDVGRSGRAEVTFDVPDFNGELRLMAVVWSQTGLGSASRPLTVRDPAPAELILPRFLAPGDEAVATVSIDNIELEGGTFTASLDATDPVSVAASELSHTIPAGQRADEGLRLTTDATGISSLRLDVQGPEGYRVSRNYQIETRSPWLPATRISTATMSPGDSWSIPDDILSGYVPGTAEVTVSFSALPLDANALYTSLARYPYGCTEQTVSRAMPLLYSEQLVAMGADEDAREPAGTQIQEAVTAVLNRQSSEGAFGLWREGDGNASPWLGAYTTDFVYRASEAGYEVPQASLDRAFESMRAVAQGDAWRAYGYDTNVWESEWHNDTEARLMRRASAYALYVLAKAGKADMSRLRYLHDRELNRIESPLARAHLGAALAFMGDRSRAFSAFEAAEEALGYQNTGDYYQTPLRDLAGVIALAAEADFNEIASRLAEKLGEDAPDPSEFSTQEKAFALLALNAMNDGGEDYRMIVEGLGNGNNNDRRYQLSADQATSDVSFTLGPHGASMFRTVMVRGAPDSPPPAVSSDLRVTKNIRTLQGGDVDLSGIDQGDQLVVTVKITPEQRRTNPVIVADLLPAGFEIETVLKPADGAREDGTDGVFAWAGEIDEAKTAEARDDRFVAAIDVRDEPVRLAYVVRAVTPGEFVMPGVNAEDMYRPSVFARSTPGRITIDTVNAATGRAEMIWLKRSAIALVAGLAVLFALDRLFPPPLERASGVSVLVSDRDGHPLRAIPTADNYWRFAADLDEIDPVFIEALLEVEDQRFWRHGGVDWLGMVRAAWSSALAGRVVSGGSTITMQTARLLEPRPRTVASKLIEMFRAHQIEARLSKEEILELYLTLTPYGGNIEGIRAASWRYFGRAPDRLSDDQIALLIALPQSPEVRRPDLRPEGADKGRKAIVSKLERLGYLDAVRAEDARMSEMPTGAYAFPVRAWHATERAARGKGGDVRSSLDSRLQTEMEALALSHAKEFGRETQVAILVIDIPTRGVRAAVGSASRDLPGGWLDLTAQARSPGSTLKPFIYAMAFDDGEANGSTKIADLPKRFASYQPDNFDRMFRGDVRVSDALQHSLNVPAVLALDRIGPQRFAATLALAGAPPRIHGGADNEAGLALALGGAGLTARELGVLYAALGDGGRAKPLVWTVEDEAASREAKGFHLMEAESAGEILSILRRAPTPEGRMPGRLTANAPQIAFKTGTSYGFRDAWAAGVSGDHAIVVWVGRADGAPRPGATGRRDALPILYEVADRAAYHLGGDGDAAARLMRQVPKQPDGALSAFDRGEDRAPHILFPPKDAELWSGRINGAPARPFVLAGRGEGTLSWFVDGQACETDAAGLPVWQPRKPGFYTISAVDASGRESRVQVRVIGIGES